MRPEAQRILEVFRSRSVRTGGMIHPADFGEAIIWGDAGCIRDAPVREALTELFRDGYLIEHPNALELSEAGERLIYNEPQPKHGARVYLVGNRILIKQTVLRGNPPEYVIDDQRERHAHQDDDIAIASAVRDAVNGRL